MVWVRRFIFIVVIIIAVSGYFVITRTSNYLERKEADKYANITARIWLATARYSNNPERYHQFRDSLLKANDITKDELNGYLHEYEKSPEKYLLFVTAVNFKIDSILEFGDSLPTPREGLPTDSVLKID